MSKSISEGDIFHFGYYFYGLHGFAITGSAGQSHVDFALICFYLQGFMGCDSY